MTAIWEIILILEEGNTRICVELIGNLSIRYRSNVSTLMKRGGKNYYGI